MQHDPFSWQITPTGFAVLDELNVHSLYADRTIRSWLTSLSPDQRKTFVNALYDMIESTDARTIDEIDWQNAVPRMLETLGELDLRTKASLLLSLSKLAGSALLNLNTN